MLEALQVATVLVLAATLSLSLAHALEFPGKMRLSKDDYYTVQQIYYPGFTYGGALEPIAVVLLIMVLFFTPSESPSFWLNAFALLAAAAMHAVYWIVTHPVNRAWVKGLEKSGVGTQFFEMGRGSDRNVAWTELRDRWEHSHMLRAALAFAALAAQVVSLLVEP
ncbi:MAG: anthrone oxygenase family protein [Pseudomonadota bacterium]